MARLLVSLLLAILLPSVPVSACKLDYNSMPTNISTSSKADSGLVKRWFSVPDFDATAGQQKWSAWPWPEVCGGQRPVRYCYKDKRSADNLDSVVIEATQLFAHAIHASNLAIDLAQGCNEDPYVLCGTEGVEEDALVIEDTTKDNDLAWNHSPDCRTDTTLGYFYEPKKQGRHQLKFCALTPQPPRKGKQQMRKRAVRTMAHELGHAIGLDHEHQRLDRDAHIAFLCQNVEGYEQGLENAKADKQGIFPAGTTDEMKADAICTQYKAAEAYLPVADAFLKSDAVAFMSNEVYSTQFDLNSIMIYSSYFGSVDPKDKSKWTMVQRDSNGQPDMHKPIWEGGSEDPANAKLTAGDIARIAQMYPKDMADGVAAQDLIHWGPMKVNVRGSGEVVQPPPDRPEQ